MSTEEPAEPAAAESPANEERKRREAWNKMQQLESVISAWELADDLEELCNRLEQELKGMGLELPAKESDQGHEKAKMLAQVENYLDGGAEDWSTMHTLRRIAVLYSEFVALEERVQFGEE